MSEMTATFRFTAAPEQAQHWQVLLQGMANDELGAYMEERVEPFGEAAKQALEHFLDEWEHMHISYCDYKHQDKDGVHRFSITMEGGGYADLCLPDFVALLEACGAKGIEQKSWVI